MRERLRGRWLKFKFTTFFYRAASDLNQRGKRSLTRFKTLNRCFSGFCESFRLKHLAIAISAL